MLAAAIILALLGFGLIAIGLRGRRIGDHPICRACGFDLIGIVPASLCPECGAGLMATLGPKPVRIGRRRRRTGLLVVGCALAVTGSVGVWVGASGWASRVSWVKYKPVWMLAREGLSPAPARSGPALEELMSRVSSGAVPLSQLTALADRALEAQDDNRLAWYGATPSAPGWGDLFESAWAGGALRQDQIERFARQIARAGFEWRPRVIEGERIPARGKVASVRTTAGQRLGIDVWLAEVTVGGRVVFSRPFNAGHLGGTNPLLARMADRDHRGYSLDAPPLAPGKYPVRATLAMPAYTGTGPPVAVRDFEVLGEIEILPVGADTVVIVEDESLRPRVENAMTIRTTRLILGSGAMRSWSVIDVRDPGVDLAYEVFWRVGDREWFVGEGFAAADANGGLQYGGPHAGFEGREGVLLGFDPATQRVDIVLRASTTAARKVVGCDRIWGGTVVIKDVPLTVTDSRNQPP